MPTGWVGYAEKPAGQCDIAGPIGIGEEAVVSNAVETVGQHVDQKAADELVDIVEVVRVGSGERAIGIDTGALGIESFRIGGTTIPTDKRAGRSSTLRHRRRGTSQLRMCLIRRSTQPSCGDR
jgi:hypothetical protein